MKKIFGNVECEIKEKKNNIAITRNYLIKDEGYVISNYFDLTNVHSNFKEEIVNNEKLLSQCIAGNFVVRGAVNNLDTSSYHLEFLCLNYNSAIYLQKLVNVFDFNSKITKRRNKLIVYIKESEKIVDLIRIMGAGKCAFSYEGVRIERDFNNNIIRLMNCEIANEQKAQKAGAEQLKYIKYLEYNYPLEKLDPKLLLVMKIRRRYPEATLVDLLTKIKEDYDVVLSKPGLSHRFAKIKEIALEHQKGRTE